jgi:pimeloyl-ACP methyl ester carboxylesterase
MRRLIASLAIGLALPVVIAAPAFAQQVQELPNIPALTSGWKDKFWTGPDGTKFHYCEAGPANGTVVILIHGSGGTATNWMANGLGMALAKTNRVIALEMRGHGQTVGPDGKRQRRTPNMDLDVLAFMDGMGIKKAHIGGFSMGGSITGQLLARAPERFYTAHFGGSGVREVEGSEFAKMVPPEPVGTAPLDAKARELYDARAKAEPAKAGVSNTNTAANVSAGAAASPTAASTDQSNLSSQPVPAAVPRPEIDLKHINIPILAVVGEFDSPYARTHRLWREAPNFKRVILRNRGHLSSYIASLAPELYRDSLVEFITSNNPK